MIPTSEKNSKRVCPLPYPDKFYAAINFVEENIPGKKPFTQETLLVLYGLQQQALQGVCKHSKPQGWDTLEAAKWKSWQVLGNMSQVEAMRLFVRTLEEEQSDWWEVMQQSQSKYEEQQVLPENQNSVQQQQQQGELNITSTNSIQPILNQEAFIQENNIDNNSQSVLRESNVNNSLQQGDTRTYSDIEQNAMNNVQQQINEFNQQKLKIREEATQQQQSVLDICLNEMQAQNHFFALTNPGGGKKPTARYDHDVVLHDHKMYVVGGICGGRLLADVWILNLDNMQWVSTQYAGRSNQSVPTTPMTNRGESNQSLASITKSTCLPIAGHSLVVYNRKILVIGGFSKDKNPKNDMETWSMDIDTLAFEKVEAQGEIPKARGGHTATLVQNKIYIFGGEDPHRELKKDLVVFDIQNLTYDTPQTKGQAPVARAQHVATAYKDKFLIVFGGGSVAQCYNDLSILDTETLEWISIPIQGQAPNPRAGHAASLAGDIWYIIGGGDNLSGCHDIYALQLRLDGPLVWHYVSDVAQIESLASEGLSLIKVPDRDCLIAFGGYNGSYHNQVVILRTPFIQQDNLLDGLNESITVQEEQPITDQPNQTTEKSLQDQKASNQNENVQKQQQNITLQDQSVISASPVNENPINLSTINTQQSKQEDEKSKQPVQEYPKLNGHKVRQDNSSNDQYVSQQDTYQQRKSSNGFTQTHSTSDEQLASIKDVNTLQEMVQIAQNQLAQATRNAQTQQETAQKELALMRKQLASSQATHENLEKELTTAKNTLQEEQESKMQIMVEVAELKKQQDIMTELQKEVERYKSQLNLQQNQSKGSQRSSNSGVWNYLTGQS